MIEDLMAHVPSSFQRNRCLPIEVKFIDALEKYTPHVLVVALQKENSIMMRMYTDLKDNPQYYHMPIIALGSAEDCEVFRKNVFQKNMRCFARPLDVEALMKTLEADAKLAAEFEMEHKEKPEEETPKKDELKADQKAVQKPGLKAVQKKAVKGEETVSDDPADTEKRLIEKIEWMNQERGRKSILVVDDDVRMLNVIKLYLQDLYDVTVVPSGRLALKFLAKKHADLVLLDYLMPDEDGPTVLQQIRTDSPDPDVPVVFLTGVSEKEKVMRGLEFRPNAYLLKPVKREVLLEKVTEIVLGLH